MTPRSWEHWTERYEHRGYRVLARAYPAGGGGRGAPRGPVADHALSVPETVAHFEPIIRELDRPPFIIGHSFGGVITQILLDHGLGAAGVAIDSVPAEGVRTLPLSEIKASFPVLDHPANRHRAVPFTLEQFHYAFTNMLSEEESAAVYERYHVTRPGARCGAACWPTSRLATRTRGQRHQQQPRAAAVHRRRADHIMPAAVTKSNAEHTPSRRRTPTSGGA